MTIADAERTALHSKLTDILGTKEASKLMEHLPPTGWDQLATKDDLEASEQRLGARIDGTNERLDATNVRIDQTNERLDATNVRIDQTNERLDATNVRIDQTNVHLHEVSTQLTALRGEVREEFTALRGEFVALRGEVREEFTALRGEFVAFRGEVREEMTAFRGGFDLALARQFRHTIYAVMGFTLAMWGPVVVMLLN